MSADDQQFWDLVSFHCSFSLYLHSKGSLLKAMYAHDVLTGDVQLSSVPSHVRQYSGDVADFIDKAVDKAAVNVRDTLASTPWIPDYARPKTVSPPPAPTAVSVSTWESMQNWVGRNKLVTGLVVCVVGYATYRTVRYSKLIRKARRARRARNGGRLEVVVIAGSPSLPLTKSLALDLERRGFIVYVICNTIDDEVMVQSLSRPDIRGLSIDITDVSITYIYIYTRHPTPSTSSHCVDHVSLCYDLSYILSTA